MSDQKEIIEKGYLKVNEIHEMYYEICGNKNGIPILYIHGGPGAGFDEHAKRLFDFTKYKVIFYDQRGAARSKPYGSIKENTTDHLVKDITYLLAAINVKTTYIFGGSWGTTLALVYAIQNPNKIKGLILRSIFLGNEDSINHYLGGGTKKYHPEAWSRFLNKVPIKAQDDIINYYLEMIISGDDSFAYEWAFYEISIFQKNISTDKVEEILEIIPYQSLALLEAHYLANNCFLPEDYILKNTDSLKDLPIWIIQGRFDMICPPIYAYQLHRKLSSSKLRIVDAGHSEKEENIEKELRLILEEIASKSH